VRIDGDDALLRGFQQKPQLAIAFFVAPRLEFLFDPTALGDVEVDACR